MFPIGRSYVFVNSVKWLFLALVGMQYIFSVLTWCLWNSDREKERGEKLQKLIIKSLSNMYSMSHIIIQQNMIQTAFQD